MNHNSETARRLSYLRNQFEIAKMHANYWQASAMTGACKMRNTSQGREPTEEEKAQGITFGWRPHTDEEKVQHALDCMSRHIDMMSAINDTIDKSLKVK